MQNSHRTLLHSPRWPGAGGSLLCVNRRVVEREMSLRRSSRAAAVAAPPIVDESLSDEPSADDDDSSASETDMKPKRKAAKGTPLGRRGKKQRVRKGEEPWADLWERLLQQGWKEEAGKRVGTDFFYIPPGVSRQAEGMRCRRDFFDSKLQVRQYLRREAGEESSEPESESDEGERERPTRQRSSGNTRNCRICRRGVGICHKPGEPGHLEETDSDPRQAQKRRPATRAAAIDYDWQAVDGVYPELKLDGVEAGTPVTPQLRQKLRSLGRRGGVVRAAFVLPSEYDLSMHPSSNDEHSSFVVNRSKKGLFQAKMTTFDDARTASFGYTSSEEESESESDDEYMRESSDEDAAVDVSELLDGDGSNYQIVVPRPSATQRMLGDLLAVFHQLQSFGSLLNLSSSFTLEQFMCALACPHENALISDIHVNLLREIKRDEILSEMQKLNEEAYRRRFDHHLLCWLSLNNFIWPELLRRQADSQTTAQEQYIADLASAVEQNLRNEYWSLPTVAKVEILRFLCDTALALGKVDDSIESGSMVPLRPLGRDSANNRYWLVGGHMFRESLDTGEFFACSEAEIQKWKTLKRQGSVRERSLAKRVRDNFAQVLMGRLPDALVNAFLCPKTVAAAVAAAGSSTEAEKETPTTSDAYAIVSHDESGRQPKRQVLIHGVDFKPQITAEIKPPPAYYGHAPTSLMMRFDIRPIAGLAETKRVRADIVAINPASTLQQTRAKMVGLAEWLPLVLFADAWSQRRPQWISDVMVATTGPALALLLLEIKDNMKDVALGRFWHEGGGFVHELQEQDPQRLLANVFKPLVNVEMNAYILANSGRGGRTARSNGSSRGPRSGRGRPAKSAKGSKGKQKGRFSSKFYLGRLVKDFFEGHGEFIGEVISVDDSEEPWIYKVRFEDGDVQEYDLNELRTVVQAPAKHKAKAAEPVEAAAAEVPEQAYVTTTKSGRRSISRVSGGSAVESQASSTWRLGEIRQLMELVEKGGVGDWETKATALGTGRTGTSLEAKYYYEKREQATKQARKRRSSHLDTCTMPGCDGSGHRMQNFDRHRNINACPLATVDDILKYSRTALQAEMIEYYRVQMVKQQGGEHTSRSGVEPQIINSYLKVAAQLRDNGPTTVPEARSRSSSGLSHGKEEERMASTGDPEVDALKQEYLEVLGRKPKGRTQNSAVWLRTKIDEAKAELAHSAADDEEDRTETQSPNEVKSETIQLEEGESAAPESAAPESAAPESAAPASAAPESAAPESTAPEQAQDVVDISVDSEPSVEKGSGSGGKRIEWSDEERQTLMELVAASGETDWDEKAAALGTGRSGGAVSQFYFAKLQSQSSNVKKDSDDAQLGSPVKKHPTAIKLPTAAWRADISTEVGSDAECYHHGDWHKVRIIGNRISSGDDSVRIHFIGWKDKYDEWVALDSGRLRSAEDGGQSQIPAPSMAVATADHVRYVRRAARRAGVALLPFVSMQEYETEDPVLLGGFFSRKSHKSRLAGVFRNISKEEAAQPRGHASASVPRQTTTSNDAGGTHTGRNLKTWGSEEIQHLKDLVKREGIGNWDEKARLLGTGRNGTALSQKYNTQIRYEGLDATIQSVPASQPSNAFVKFESTSEAAASSAAAVDDGKMIMEPRNIFRARLPADITWKTERTGWTMHAASIPAADRSIYNVADKRSIKRLAKRAGNGVMSSLKYDDKANSIPTLKMSEAWSRQTQLATTCPAVLLQLTVLESGLNQAQLRSASGHRRQEQMEKRRLEQRQRQAARDLKQVTNALDRIIAQIERQHNKGARASERQRSRSSRPKKNQITYEYVGFEQLKDNMYCECMWDDDEGGDEETWYRAFVKTKSDTEATLFYPDSGEEETMYKVDVAPGSVRCLGEGITPPLAPWIEEENAVDEGALAIKALPIPEREPLDSTLHESMYTVWEAIRYIGDGYGRPRANKFMKNISRKEYPDYYEVVEKPKCLEQVRKAVETKRYKSIDAFEEDMTLIFENNREYFDPDSQAFADIEILQSIFWEALGAVESGRSYVLEETAGEFKKPKKKKSASSKLPPIDGKGGPKKRESSAKAEPVPCPDGVDPVMFQTYNLVKNKKDKTHRVRSKMFIKLASKTEWPEYYELIKKPIDLSTIHERLISKQYKEWQEFEDDLQLMCSNAREFNKPGSQPYEDAAELAKVVRRCRPGEEKARLKEQDKQEAARRREMTKAEKRQAREAERALRDLEGKGKNRGLTFKTLKAVNLPSAIEQQHMVFDTVCKLRDGDRQRAELFFALPDRIELPELPPFPPVSVTPPEGLAHGTVDKLVDGVLPDLAKAVPTEAELRGWTEASQLAFWEQRRLFWGRSKFKMTDLQRECRKRDIWPGGDLPDVRHRLLRYDFCCSVLLACETKTELEAQEEDSEIGILYYKIVQEPIDLNTIRASIDGGKYSTMGALEKDLLKLFNNARKFDAYVNDPPDRFVSKDADALQAITVRRIKEVAERMKKLAAGATSPKRSSGPSNASKKVSKKATSTSAAAAAAAASSPRKKSQKKKPAVSSAAAAIVQLTSRIASAFHAVTSCKDGRRKRSDIFMDLPDREDYPDYYDLIAEPIDLNTIGKRVKSGGFKTWEDFEGLMMKVFSNAKQYNHPDSEIYEDAEAMQSLFEDLASEAEEEEDDDDESDEESEDSEDEEESEDEDESEDDSEEEDSSEEDSEEEEEDSEEEDESEEESEEEVRPAKKRKGSAAAASPRPRSISTQRKKQETSKELQARIASGYEQIVNCKDGRRKRALLFVSQRSPGNSYCNSSLSLSLPFCPCVDSLSAVPQSFRSHNVARSVTCDPALAAAPCAMLCCVCCLNRWSCQIERIMRITMNSSMPQSL